MFRASLIHEGYAPKVVLDGASASLLPPLGARKRRCHGGMDGFFFSFVCLSG